jgi:hypothetical protein
LDWFKIWKFLTWGWQKLKKVNIAVAYFAARSFHSNKECNQQLRQVKLSAGIRMSSDNLGLHSLHFYLFVTHVVFTQAREHYTLSLLPAVVI